MHITKLNLLGDMLQVMEQRIDFAAFAAEVDLAAPCPGRERGGRPPFPIELMVHVLLIQQLFNLNDEQMEFQLLDRLSFQRSVGPSYLAGLSLYLDLLRRYP